MQGSAAPRSQSLCSLFFPTWKPPPSGARTKRWELERPAQYASDKVSTPCLAVSNGSRHRGVGPVITGQFSRIFRVHRTVNRRSVMAGHKHADVKTNNLFCVRRVVFWLG